MFKAFGKLVVLMDFLKLSGPYGTWMSNILDIVFGGFWLLLISITFHCNYTMDRRTGSFEYHLNGNGRFSHLHHAQQEWTCWVIFVWGIILSFDKGALVAEL